MKIYYKKSVSKDFKKIHPAYREKIKQELERDLVTNAGKSQKLRGEYAGLYRLKVTEYRVVYTFIPEGILILRVRHRKEAYR